jgi:hypothetical protein
MIKLKCKEKGRDKVVEGYNQQHAETLLAQHMIKHENEKNREKEKKDGK